MIDQALFLAARTGAVVARLAPHAVALLGARRGLSVTAEQPPAASPVHAATAPVPAATAPPQIPPPQVPPPQVPNSTSTGTGTTGAGTTEFPTVLLSTLVWSALLAVLVIIVLPERTREQRDRIRVMGLVGVGAPLLLALLGVNYEIGQDLIGGGTSFEEHHAWITTAPIHIDYHLAADGVSLPLLLMSTVCFAAAMTAAWRLDRRVKLFTCLLLVLEVGVNGSLVAYDYVLLLLFLGSTQLPLYLLVSAFGGAGRERAARRLLAFGLVSDALLLLMVVLVGVKAAQGGFNLLQVGGPGDAGVLLTVGGIGAAAFWLSVAAFAIRLGVVPLHSWLPGAVAGASAPVAAVVAAMVPTLGAYGLIRVGLAGFPDQAQQASLVLAILAMITTVWGTAGAFAQDDLRRLIAYATVGQMGVVLLAISAETSIALNGAVLLLVAHGLSATMLILLAGGLEERTRTRSIRRLGGLAWQMPKLTALWVFAGLCAVGVPMLAGFAGLVNVMIGAYPAHRIATIVVLAAVLPMTGYMVWMLQRVFFGPAREAFNRVRDATTLELLYLIPLVVVVLAFGIAPGRIIPLINNGVELIAQRLPKV